MKFSFLLCAAFASLCADPFVDDQYSFIKSALEHYTRPFTVLNLGGRDGYTERILQDFPQACIVSFEPLSENTPSSQVALLGKKITLTDLQKLSEVEHFDAVLALAFHPELVPKPKSFTTKLVVSTLSSLGHDLFIELAAPDKNYQKALNSNQWLVQQETSTQTYHLQNNTRTPLKDHWFAKEFTTFLFTTYDKSLRTLQSSSPWTLLVSDPQGISLPTFLVLEGVFPSKESLRDSLSLLPWKQFPTLTPWNIKVGGKELSFRPLFTSSPFSKESTLNLVNEETKEGLEETLTQ